MRLKIQLLTNWSHLQNVQGPACFQGHKSSAAIQVSWAEYDGQKPLRVISIDELKQMAVTFGQKNGSGALVESACGSCFFGSFGTATFSSATHPRIQVWFLTDGRNFILATHICCEKPDPDEVRETEAIVSSLALGPGNPD